MCTRSICWNIKSIDIRNWERPTEMEKRIHGLEDKTHESCQFLLNWSIGLMQFQAKSEKGTL